MNGVSQFVMVVLAGAWLAVSARADARAIEPGSYAPATSPKISRPTLPWGRDLERAQRQARTEQKHVLVSFVGSDWCGWCLRLRREVFAKPEFQEFAQTNLVLVEVDFPRDNRQTAAQREVNAALARRFGVSSVPTMVLLDDSGQMLHSWGFEDGGARHYLAEFRQAVVGPGSVTNSVASPNPAKSSVSPKKSAAKPASKNASKPGKSAKKSASAAASVKAPAKPQGERLSPSPASGRPGR